MTAIDVGAAATNRAASYAYGSTRVLRTNPANDTGTITAIEIWAASNISNCEVATFYVVSGNNLSTRDSETIGAVTAGSKQTFSGLSMDVTAGDYIGNYFSAGGLEGDSSGGGGKWADTGDQIPCTNNAFTLDADDELSLYGIGTTPAAISKINGVAYSAISKIDGVTKESVLKIDGVTI